MARKSWFDAASNEVSFSQYVEQMESWQAAMADGVIEPEEVQQQAQRVSDLLQALEPKLNDQLHEELTQVFYELAVLYGMQQLLSSAADK
ncbi:MAG: hypothetical protein FJZ90_05405 [Chloroflexi bacterium]|nr:hypothetical protein [Chloroflexota bacterium]